MISKKSTKQESPTFSVAVEDRFVIFRLEKPDGLLPEGELAEDIIASFRPLKTQYSPLLDLTGVTSITSDLMDFARQWSREGASVIVDRHEATTMDRWFKIGFGDVIPIDRPAWKYSQVSYAHLLDEDDIWLYGLKGELEEVLDLAGRVPATREEWKQHIEGGSLFDSYEDYLQHYQTANSIMLLMDEKLVVGTRYLKAKFTELGRNSLLTQIALMPGGRDIQALPFHASALYKVKSDTSNMEAIVARPAALASMTQAVFSREFNEFNRIIRDQNASENDLQRFFERNDVFIRMLGYKRVYPKIVLERDDGTKLIPDFMIEPVGGEWCDILDIKLPDKEVAVGTRDRKDFAYSVHQLHAQLREYAAYFDEEKYRKRIISKYGLKAYRPKLIGVIGNNFDQADDVQIRRVMTQYNNFDVFTYEQLKLIAQQRLLI